MRGAALAVAVAACSGNDDGGAAEAQPVSTAQPAGAAGNCEFEYLGDWVRCENSEFPNFVETDAADLESCQQLCLAREDCTGVTDWLWLGLPDLGCSLYVSTCDSPAFVSWGEEDGAREYRRSCTAAAP